MMIWTCEERRDAGVGRRVLEIESPGKRKVGRPNTKSELQKEMQMRKEMGGGKSAKVAPSKRGSSLHKK